LIIVLYQETRNTTQVFFFKIWDLDLLENSFLFAKIAKDPKRLKSQKKDSVTSLTAASLLLVYCQGCSGVMDCITTQFDDEQAMNGLEEALIQVAGDS
jgi:hypothetical protein